MSSTTTASPTTTCVTLTPGKVATYLQKHAIPTTPMIASFAAAVASVLFGLLLGLHLFQGILYRKKFCWVIIMGAIWETASFVLRTLGARYQQNVTFATVSQILVLLAPLCKSPEYMSRKHHRPKLTSFTFDYMVLGRMVYYFLPEQKLYIKATRFSVCFVWLNITSFLVQLEGGLLLTGTVQSAKQLFILAFAVVIIHRRALVLERDGVLATTGKTKWRMMLYCLYASLLLISIRIVYRLIEFSRGTRTNNPILYHEFYLYCLDALPMCLPLLAMSIGHPGRTLVGPDSEFPHLTRKEKKAAKAAAKSEKLQMKMDGVLWHERVVSSQIQLLQHDKSSSFEAGGDLPVQPSQTWQPRELYRGE